METASQSNLSCNPARRNRNQMHKKRRAVEPIDRKGATDKTSANELPALPAETREVEYTTRDPLQDDVITAEQAATILKIHPVTVRLKAAAGQIPGRQIGNRWRFSRTRLNEWLRAA
jgi:excisionase family DNA binding protein